MLSPRLRSASLSDLTMASYELVQGVKRGYPAESRAMGGQWRASVFFFFFLAICDLIGFLTSSGDDLMIKSDIKPYKSHGPEIPQWDITANQQHHRATAPPGLDDLPIPSPISMSLGESKTDRPLEAF